MGIFQNLFSSGASTLVDAVGSVLDNVVTTKEEKMQLENEMRKSEMQYQMEMRRMSLDEKKALLQDVGDARKRDSEIQQSANASRLSKNTGPFLALGTTAIAFVLFLLVIFYNKLFGPESLDATTKDIIIYILGC